MAMYSGMYRAAAIACVGAVVLCTHGEVPDIGGNPMHTEEDALGAAGLWGMTVYSYVFDHSFLPPQEFGQVLEPGEMLFAYLLDADDALPVSISHFAVGNPNLVAILTVGYETDIEPPGFSGLLREDPFTFGYSQQAQSSIFGYNDPLDPFASLDPTEWSLVFYVAQAEMWTAGPATGTGGGIGANGFVPVPIPAPAVLSMIALAALGRSGRGRSRAKAKARARARAKT
jgi:hypothetical protein